MVRIALALSTLLLLAACQSMAPARLRALGAARESLREHDRRWRHDRRLRSGCREQDGRRVCTTDYSVRVPNRPVLYSEIVFDAKPVQGGILCTNGRWRAKDGSTAGTTPFEVFIKDGVRRRSP